MKTAIFVVFLTFSIFLLPSPVWAQTPGTKQVPIPTTSPSPQININDLNIKVDKLRDENYQNAITRADDAGKKADRLLNWIVGITTILGVVLALITFIIGGSFINSLRELRTHVNAARKNASLIAALSRKAEQKGQELQKEIAAIKKKQEESKGKLQTQEKEIDSLINKAQGTISEITALKSSANFISNASYSPSASYPASFGGTIPMGSPSESVSTSAEKCDTCHKPLDLLESILGTTRAIAGKKICRTC